MKNSKENSKLNSKRPSRTPSHDQLANNRKPKVNNIAVAESKNVTNQKCDYQSQKPSSQITNNINGEVSIQNQLIQKLSEQVKGLEDKQDTVKKGN